MSGKNLEDEIILALLERGDPTAAELGSDEDAEAETLRRLYTEVLGLLPLAIAPVEPGPELKERLLASIVADAPAKTPTAPLAPLLSFRPGEPEPPLTRPEPEAAPARPQAPPLPSRIRRLWPLGLAAGIALVAISGLVLSFLQDRDHADRELAELRRRLADSTARERALTDRVSNLEQSSSELIGRLSLITGVGSTACPLRPEAGGPAFARGVLYVAADHQHWYLKVAGLPPAGPGRLYQLWFLTAAGPVDGGKFETAQSASAELDSPTMPAGIRGFAITLEPRPGVAQPTGPRMLAGEQVTPLL